MPERKPVEAAAPAVRPAVERPAMDPAMAELLQKSMQVERSLAALRQRLGLGGFDRSAVKDEQIAKLQDAADAARKALEAKALAVIKADAEGGPIVAQYEEIQKKTQELQQQARELETKMAGVRQRLGQQAARGELTPPTPKDPELAAMRKEAEVARKTLEDALISRIKADPEGAKLLQEREELKAKIEALRKPAAEPKP
jgi:chromosome segregation ATPase